MDRQIVQDRRISFKWFAEIMRVVRMIAWDWWKFAVIRPPVVNPGNQIIPRNNSYFTDF